MLHSLKSVKGGRCATCLSKTNTSAGMSFELVGARAWMRTLTRDSVGNSKKIGLVEMIV